MNVIRELVKGISGLFKSEIAFMSWQCYSIHLNCK